MSAASTSSGQEKYTWFTTPRANPAKRPVQERVHDFHEVESAFTEATAIAQASRCIQCAMPFCVMGCPQESPIAEWLGLLAEGRFDEAVELTRRASNLPEICSRLCPSEQLCESMCVLNERGHPIPIGALEKFLQDYALVHRHNTLQVAPPKGYRVAVVGSGPAGLSCAAALVRRGFQVTVWESHLEPGGSWFGRVPAFKVEKYLVERQLRLLIEQGVVFERERLFGREVGLADLRTDFDAVYLALGTVQPLPADLGGSQLKGVESALSFLSRVHGRAEDQTSPEWLREQKVLVLGGGDMAVDCLRSALRCGAGSATAVYRRDAANLRGCRHDYQLSLEEGAQFQFLARPVRLEGDAQGQVTRVVCQHTELGEPEADGRPRVVPVPHSEFTVPADIVIVAFGFVPATRVPEAGLADLPVDENGYVKVDDHHMTGIHGVFAGGDLRREPGQEIHAVRDAQKAAEAMEHYLVNRAASRVEEST